MSLINTSKTEDWQENYSIWEQNFENLEDAIWVANLINNFHEVASYVKMDGKWSKKGIYFMNWEIKRYKWKDSVGNDREGIWSSAMNWWKGEFFLSWEENLGRLASLGLIDPDSWDISGFMSIVNESNSESRNTYNEYADTINNFKYEWDDDGKSIYDYWWMKLHLEKVWRSGEAQEECNQMIYEYIDSEDWKVVKSEFMNKLLDDTRFKMNVLAYLTPQIKAEVKEQLWFSVMWRKVNLLSIDADLTPIVNAIIYKCAKNTELLKDIINFTDDMSVAAMVNWDFMGEIDWNEDFGKVVYIITDVINTLLEAKKDGSSTWVEHWLYTGAQRWVSWTAWVVENFGDILGYH